MEEFFTRLRERKLVQWALAYVAAAFALVQVIDIVAQRFGWPDAVERFIIIALAIGFFVALVLAWYHGERDAQKVSGTELLILALLLALGGGALWHFAPAPRMAAAPLTTLAAAGTTTPVDVKAATAISAIAIPAKSIAVLPFENLSADKENAYFADGMQDLILTKLADIGDLKVISRTSTEQYGSHPGNLHRIAQELGVATILEGSVQKAGNQVLINVQLIDAATDSHVWAQSYMRTLDNIFGVEGEVAQKVADALDAKLTVAEKLAIAKAPTHNKQALDAFLKGAYYLNHAVSTLDPVEQKHAVALLEQATRLDPDFGDAFSALSLAYQHLGGHDKQAEAAARRALALNPDDAEAHRMVAYTMMYEGKLEQALQQAKEAVRLAPGNALINNGLGNVYYAASQLDKAAATYRHAIKLDPKQNIIRINLGSVSMAQRRYADARDVLQTATMIDPSSIHAATWLASAQELGWGDLDAARKTLQGVPTPVESSGVLSDAWYWVDLYARDYPGALAVIRKAPAAWFESQEYPLTLYEAQAYRAQGDTGRAKAAFAEARDQLGTWIKSKPKDAALHASLSLALAGLGDGNGAETEAQRAIKLAGASSGNYPLVNLATVDAWTGNTDAALHLLHELLGKPSGDVISVSLLKLDPAWDPIRHDPRFQALLKQTDLSSTPPAGSSQ
ncbi:tetratricopeptide repeat protein [Rhodanobacter lindaniclasticus]